jgi:hypothetical protein
MTNFDCPFDSCNPVNTEEGFDFDAFINYPEEKNESFDVADFQFTELDFDCLTSNYSFSSVPDCSPSTDVSNTFSPSPQTYRGLVDTWAHADPRSRSIKQKRRDAAIDLHLQRFVDACPDARNTWDANLVPFSAPGSYSHSSSQSPQSSQDSFCDLSRTTSTYSVPTPVSTSSRSGQPSNPAPKGLELVLDMNMNATTQLPKKQKKRTKAQINDYINARRNGACLKHRKQHKKCNCAEKVAAGAVSHARIKKSSGLSHSSCSKLEYLVGVDSTLPSLVHTSIQSSLTTDGLEGMSFVSSLAGIPAEMSDSMPPDRRGLDHYVCLMPGCTFTSDTVPSLQLHYNGHSRPVQSPSCLSVIRRRSSMAQGALTANAIQQPLLWSSSQSRNSSAVDVSPEYPAVTPLGENRPIATTSGRVEPFGSTGSRIFAERQEPLRGLQIIEGLQKPARIDRGEGSVVQQVIRQVGVEKHRTQTIASRPSVSVHSATMMVPDFRQLSGAAFSAISAVQLLLTIAAGIWRALQTAVAAWFSSASASYLSRHISQLILDEPRQHSHLCLTIASRRS